MTSWVKRRRTKVKKGENSHYGHLDVFFKYELASVFVIFPVDHFRWNDHAVSIEKFFVSPSTK